MVKSPRGAYHTAAGGLDKIEVNFHITVGAIKEINKIGRRTVW